MKALIFNSGIGKRMGDLTVHCPKSVVHLYNDETIFERQVRLLQEAGIHDIVITTGPYPEMLEEICSKSCYSNMSFSFVHNEIYDSSNYIYSMYKAKDYLSDDFLIMHGDLVFDRSLLPSILKNKNSNVCLINKQKKLPEKDFKGRIVDGKLREVSINIFDEDCFAFQPLYKLDKETIGKWLAKVEEFVNDKNINVYAENALNEISSSLKIIPMSYSNHFIDEVDNKNDLARVNRCIEKWDYKKQIMISASNHSAVVEKLLNRINSKRPLFVVDKHFAKEIDSDNVFSDFTPNPKYEEVLNGLNLFKTRNCDAIVSIGGGSCIDVAKTIKLCLNTNQTSEEPLFKQRYKHTAVKHIAIPSTSGTGSESTRHAVVYYNGVKQSISNPSILPDYAILSSKLIRTVPDDQKKATMMDAFCQCLESLWSKKSTRQSRAYALKGLELIKDNYRCYLDCNPVAIKRIQIAASYSGKAINISETTAAHALSYKISSLYNLPHGHAVAICMNAILSICNVDYVFNNVDYRKVFKEIVYFFGLKMKIEINNCELGNLVSSVNVERLSNFPYPIDIEKIYKFIAE